MSQLFAAVVVPCLDEAATLPQTCKSLGFSVETTVPNNSTLVLVDNGSTDGTFEFIKRLQKDLPAGSIIIVNEPERGYVPPRSRGNEVAAEYAASCGISEEDVLIIQADADTYYHSGYVDAMRGDGQAAGLGTLLNGCIAWPPNFCATNPVFLELCQEVDQEFDALLAGLPSDVIIDDKVCAYRLADYRAWGGHQREWDSIGEEIHAETTRLFLRGRAKNAQRRLCDAALAWHSPRRLISEPAMSFATAGFPRTPQFQTRWLQSYTGPNTLNTFSARHSRSQIALAIAARRAHLLGLFGLLPIIVARTLGEPLAKTEDSALLSAFDAIPFRDRKTLLERPGVFLNDVFFHIDKWVGM